MKFKIGSVMFLKGCARLGKLKKLMQTEKGMSVCFKACKIFKVEGFSVPEKAGGAFE